MKDEYDFSQSIKNPYIKKPNTIALTEFDAYTRFKLLATQGNPEVGLEILDKLDVLTKTEKR